MFRRPFGQGSGHKTLVRQDSRHKSDKVHTGIPSGTPNGTPPPVHPPLLHTHCSAVTTTNVLQHSHCYTAKGTHARVQDWYITGTSLVHHGYTTGTPRILHGYTAGTLWIHWSLIQPLLQIYCNTATAIRPRVHTHGYNTGTPRVQHWYTTGTPLVHHWYTTDTPRVHRWHTTDTPLIHPLLQTYCNTATAICPRVHTHGYNTGTSLVHHGYTTDTPRVHRGHTTDTPLIQPLLQTYCNTATVIHPRVHTHGYNTGTSKVHHGYITDTP
jgi:hypothetical protein